MRDRLIFTGVAVVAVVIGALFLSYGNVTVPAPRVPSAAQPQPEGKAVPFTELVHGSKSSVSERVNYLITSQGQLNELWKMTDAKGASPVIDFKTHAVLGIFAGAEPCSAISVAKIEDATTRTVSVTLSKPDGACAGKITGNSPYVLVVVETTPLPLTHADIPTTVSCPK